MCNTVVIKLECRSADFFCEQHFKNSKSMSVRTIGNIFCNNKQKITNEGGREDQVRNFKKKQLEK